MTTPETLLMMQESRLAQEAELFEKWLTKLDQNLSNVINALSGPPEPKTPQSVMTFRAELRRMFFTLVDSLGVPRLDIFVVLGSPPMLRHFAGLSVTPLNAADWDLELYYETFGNRPKPSSSGRAKAVVEPLTGLTWVSATALAAELGCAPISVYKHLSGDRSIRNLKGRRFEYSSDPEKAKNDPRLPVNWSEEERERQRAKARELGFELKI